MQVRKFNTNHKVKRLSLEEIRAHKNAKEAKTARTQNERTNASDNQRSHHSTHVEHARTTLSKKRKLTTYEDTSSWNQVSQGTSQSEHLRSTVHEKRHVTPLHNTTSSKKMKRVAKDKKSADEASKALFIDTALNTEKRKSEDNNRYKALVKRVEKTKLFEVAKLNRSEQSSNDLAFLDTEFHRLGNYSSKKWRVFERSKTAIECAKSFTNYFFADQSNQQVVMLGHHTKVMKFVEDIKLAKPTNPSCVSFVTAKLYDQKCCFVSYSSTFSFGSRRALARSIEQFNQCNTSYPSASYRFIILDSLNGANIGRSIQQVSYDLGIPGYEANKYCSEQMVTTVLKNLFRRYGTHLTIEGIENAAFYPYDVNVKYGRRAARGTPQALVEPKNKTRVLLDDGLFYEEVTCCTNCLKGKLATVLILRNAQMAGESFLKDPTAVIDYPTRDVSAPEVVRFEEESGAVRKAVHEHTRNRYPLFNCGVTSQNGAMRESTNRKTQKDNVSKRTPN